MIYSEGCGFSMRKHLDETRYTHPSGSMHSEPDEAWCASRAMWFNPLILWMWKLRQEKCHPRDGCPRLELNLDHWIPICHPSHPATLFKGSYLTLTSLCWRHHPWTLLYLWLLIVGFSLFPASYQRQSFHCLNAQSVLLERWDRAGNSILQCSQTSWTVFLGESPTPNPSL